MARRSTILLVILFCLCSSCGPRRIPKRPVPRADQIRAISLLAQGDVLLKDGKDHLALLKYLEASETDPYHEAVFNKLAVAYLRLKMYTQANAAISRSLGLEPNYAYAHNTKGIIELSQDLAGEAAKSFRKAVSLKSGVASFHINLGYTYIQLRKPREARKEYATAIKINPGIFTDQDLVELAYSSGQQQTADQFYELAKVFAELNNLDFTLRYLGQAFSAGFSDSTRILTEEAFRRFLSNERFRRFLMIHGITL